MQISIIVHTADYRGDHAADIAIALDYIEGEAVGALIERAQLGKNPHARGEMIELRLVQKAP
jgi:hypothetical protein